jgi:hypothetical protein
MELSPKYNCLQLGLCAGLLRCIGISESHSTDLENLKLKELILRAWQPASRMQTPIDRI